MNENVLGIIAPHPPIIVEEVGGSQAHVTERTLHALEVAASLVRSFAPETLVLMSPHAPLVRDAFLIDDSESLAGNLGAFGARSVALHPKGDPELAARILEEAATDGVSVVGRSTSPRLDPGALDHGAIVPLSFLDRRGQYRLVEISLSFLPLSEHRVLGGSIRRAVRAVGRRVVFVASGDCSHRLTPDAPSGYSRHGAEFDAALVRLLDRADFGGLEELDPYLIEAAGECGLRSFITLGGYLEGSDVRSHVLAYEGPWGVGYLTAAIGSPGVLEPLSASNEAQTAADEESATREQTLDTADITTEGTTTSPLVQLARRTIETYVREHRVIAPPALEGVLATRHGAFVSLHRQGELRGCIGTIGPTQDNLAEEIVHNAIQAATADPRFPPLGADELADLDISVDVLHEAEPATMADLDARAFGVIVSADWRRGLLLPDLDGVDTPEEQIAIALRKAGIAPHEQYRLERFRVDRYH